MHEIIIFSIKCITKETTKTSLNFFLNQTNAQLILMCDLIQFIQTLGKYVTVHAGASKSGIDVLKKVY